MRMLADALKGTRFLRLQPSLPPRYRPCNPSILQTHEGYIVTCRGLTLADRRPKHSRDDEPAIRSRSVLLRLTPHFAVLDQREITLKQRPLRRTSIQGIEDIRLVKTREALFALFATADRHPSGHIHLSICRLRPDGSAAGHRPLVGPFDDRQQKNWLPFVDANGNICAIYGYDPVTVVRIRVNSGRYDVEARIAHSWPATNWRGSAGPIAFGDDGRLLLLVHEVVIRKRRSADSSAVAMVKAERVYLHRFVECDPGFALTRVSRPFVFVHEGVEFACGMTLSHDGADVVIGVGLEDVTAYLCQISVARVERLLDEGDNKR